MRHTLRILVTFFGFLYAASSDARTWYVKPDSTGDAPTILAAMDSASAGDEVLLAPGTYTSSSQGSASPSYMIDLKPGVSVRGEAGPEHTIIDATGSGRAIRCLDVGEVRIEGLTIAHGTARRQLPEDGGGVWSTGDSRPVISNCIVRDCYAGESGGGIYCENAVITNCQILDNVAGLSYGSGGGICCSGSVISGCLIRGNRVVGDGSALGGGVVAAGPGSISDCWIEGNTASAGFGAVAGGISAGFVSVRDCVFLKNTARSAASGAARGGGARASGEVSGCVFVGNRVIASGGEPGEGAAASADLSTFNMTNCTLIANSASGGAGPVGGVFAAGGGSVTSTIIASNEGRACGGSPTLRCCDLFGNSLGDALCGVDGGGNFSGDAEFCATDPATSLNFTLQEDSPCAPGRHPDGVSCGTIGAVQVGCGTVSSVQRTWTQVKEAYR